MNYFKLTNNIYIWQEGRQRASKLAASWDRLLDCYCCSQEGGLRRSNESYKLSDLSGGDL